MIRLLFTKNAFPILGKALLKSSKHLIYQNENHFAGIGTLHGRLPGFNGPVPKPLKISFLFDEINPTIPIGFM
jgi:hypothetical protein